MGIQDDFAVDNGSKQSTLKQSMICLARLFTYKEDCGVGGVNSVKWKEIGYPISEK